MKRLLLASALLCMGTAIAGTLKIDGEVYAQRTASLMPPAVDDLWQFNITQLAPDGSPVKQGDVVLAFDGSELMKRLTEKQSVLKEKQSQLDKLLLELAERERNERLGTAEAMSNREKAQRKTTQPEEIIGGIPYRKLMVARQQADRRAALVEQRERLAAEQRVQERRLLGSEVEQLQGEVKELQASLMAMNVTHADLQLFLFDCGRKYKIILQSAGIKINISTGLISISLFKKYLDHVNKFRNAMGCRFYHIRFFDI